MARLAAGDMAARPASRRAIQNEGPGIGAQRMTARAAPMRRYATLRSQSAKTSAGERQHAMFFTADVRRSLRHRRSNRRSPARNHLVFMRTEMLSPAVEEAWLEFCTPQLDAPQTRPLDGGPFTIGRNESCGLHIDSSRVSREHALIEAHDGQFHIRDLGSTNGTFVNGERIREAPLQDGDVVLIADVECSFHHRRPGAATRATATQVMAPQASEAAAAGRELVHAVRSLQDRMLRGAIDVRLSPIVTLAEQEQYAQRAGRPESGALALRSEERALLGIDCRLAVRYRQLERFLAVEQMLVSGGATRLFIELAAAEIGDVDLAESLERLRLMAGDRLQLAAEISDSAICDIAYVRDFLRMLRDLDMKVAYSEFAGGQVRAAAHRDIAPDYLMLSPRLVRDADRNSGRRRQMEEIVRAARDMNCLVIAVGVTHAAEAEACANAGCRFGQGEYFTPAPRSAPRTPVRGVQRAALP